MSDHEAATGGRNRIEATEVGGTWFVRRLGTQFWGEGPSLSEAHGDLRRREQDYEAFLERAGIPLIPVTGLKRWLCSAMRPAGRIVAALAIFSLFMVPVSYAISTGIWRGIKQSEIKVGGREFWTRLENGLIEFSTEKHDLPPEQVEKLRAAVHRIVLRIRPFTAELRQIFEPVEEAPPQPEKQ